MLSHLFSFEDGHIVSTILGYMVILLISIEHSDMPSRLVW